MPKNQLVWSGTAWTRPSDDLTKEITRYVETMIKALKKAGIIPAA